MAHIRASQFAGILWSARPITASLCAGAPHEAEARNSLVLSIPNLPAEAIGTLTAAGIKDTRKLYQKTRQWASIR